MSRALGEHQTLGCGRPLVRLQAVEVPRQDFFRRAARDTMRVDCTHRGDSDASPTVDGLDEAARARHCEPQEPAL
jgi:hypothetical protein